MTFNEYIASLSPEEQQAHKERVHELSEQLKNAPPPPEGFWEFIHAEHLCLDIANHRGPQGPNEDVATCFRCNYISFKMRPEGETFGEHLPDCVLPINHQSYCMAVHP